MQFPFYSTQYEPKMIYIPTPPNGGLLEILLEFLKEGMNLNRNFQRGEGVQTKRTLYGVGEGEYGYFVDQFVSCSFMFKKWR